MRSLLVSILLFLPSLAWAKDLVGTISGQVLTQDGKPAKGYVVSAIQAPPQGSSSSETLRVVSRAKTDDKGHYRLEKILPGQYLVLGGPLERPTYYPGTLAAGEAKSIDVKPGATVSKIDFTMTAALPPAKLTLSFGPANGCVSNYGAAPMVFLVQLILDVDGVASNIKVIRGDNPTLREAIKKSVGGWRFRPATENGRPIKAKVTMEVTVWCKKDNEGVEP
jgi:hypothetical protein